MTNTHRLTGLFASRLASRLALVGAIVAVLLATLLPMAMAATPAHEGDCYAMNVGTSDAPWWVLVSDTTTDGLCHNTEEPAVQVPTDVPAGWVGVDVSSPLVEELRVALLEAGFTGDPNDGTDDVIYAPVGTVLDVPGGTWTVGQYGPVRCVDWATTGAECDGHGL